MVAAVLAFPSQGSVLVSVNWLSGSHVPFGEIVVTTELVLTVLVVPLSESEELTVVTYTGPRVRFGLNVGVKEEVTEGVGYEVLVSSLSDSVVDAFTDLVTPTEGETTKTKKNQENITQRIEISKVMRHKAASPTTPQTLGDQYTHHTHTFYFIIF